MQLSVASLYPNFETEFFFKQLKLKRYTNVIILNEIFAIMSFQDFSN